MVLVPLIFGYYNPDSRVTQQRVSDPLCVMVGGVYSMW